MATFRISIYDGKVHTRVPCARRLGKQGHRQLEKLTRELMLEEEIALEVRRAFHGILHRPHANGSSRQTRKAVQLARREPAHRCEDRYQRGSHARWWSLLEVEKMR